MKKQIVTLLCTVVLTVGLTATAIFGSTKLNRAEKHAGAAGTTGFQPFDTDFAEGTVSDLLPFGVCAGCMAIAAAIKVLRHQIKTRRIRMNKKFFPELARRLQQEDVTTGPG